MKILSLSDKIVSFIYSPRVRHRFEGADIIIGCGDLPYYYLEYVLNALDQPLYFVRGNHDKVVEYNTAGQRSYPHGGVDLHRRVINDNGLLLAGVEGSIRYRPGKFQYTQADMWNHVFVLVPGLLVNRLRYGRFLDIFVTHAPPAGTHEGSDLPHKGINAFCWLNRVFHPQYHIHGHIHIYRPDEIIATDIGKTQILNTYGFLETEIKI